MENKQIDLHDMIQEIEYEQEYTNRILLFRTYFKHGTLYYPASDFNPREYTGTRKQYDILMTTFYESDTYGKIIGVETFEPPVVKPTEIIEKDVHTPSTYRKWSDIPKEYKSEIPENETYEAAINRSLFDRGKNRERRRMIKSWHACN
jgi:hypothetical protein